MDKSDILRIDNLCVEINEKEIIKNLSLKIQSGEIHAIMGKNGSGKSTLSKVIAGHPKYNVTKGKIFLCGDDITDEEPEVRSHKGLFLGFQYPVEIPGVNNIDFLRLAYNSKKNFNNQDEIDPLSFLEIIDQKVKEINIDISLINRNVNEGFSGGEKKKNEILQMSLLSSRMYILDEIDSGLDIDALKNISNNINKLQDKSNSLLLITHYERLLSYLKPDYIHIMQDGRIVYTGGSDIAKQIEKHGYRYFTKNNLTE
uniref:Probable ATP-dependent transporter ycf16 n=1 Tax=Platysiphonia delicata TaxID=2006979 RepID=A0A1Z1M1B4_9FLOR|nr:Iron-sulfur cluster formation ABC transporterATP-binding subunit [Platysiphonia delicata]ARW59575.1 Iron-sulfur cluster formation ABC transporterATP-binding subunit [Platysiphonia delicata]